MSQHAGVSIYTVSRALGGGQDVAASTRERILQVANALGYVPNRAAQELRKNTRSSVTVLTASTSNAYYLDLMKGVQRVLRPTSRTVVVADIAAEGRYTRAVEDATVQQLIQSRTAGVIATLTLSAQNVKLLDDWDIPVVFVDSAPPAEATQVPSLTTDNVAASVRLGRHLAEHRFTSWLFVAYPTLWSTREPREQGLREAAAAAGAELHVLETDNDEASAFDQVRDWFETPGRVPPDVVVAGNNPLLHGTMRYLREKGIRIPQDIALVAFDEFPWAPLLDPPLTVVNEGSEAIGVEAATILSRIIDEQVRAETEGRPPKPKYLPEDRQVASADLIIRASCGC
ncbi:LacI family DNA-binding transcriptional regulator [Knoellia koreensis]|uniref:LacI family DNA-binding transcriptional regulator n=1 Tax=Knoellia koreensis TaxID=2730921 RepID=UPI003211F4D2